MRAFTWLLGSLLLAGLIGAIVAFPAFELASRLGPWPFHRVAGRVTMLVLALELAWLCRHLGIRAKADFGHGRVTAKEKWLVDIPVSIYLGWITVATIANASDVLNYLKWNGWGLAPEIWAIILLATGLGLAVAMSLTRGDIAYQLVLVWAFVGIAVKQAGTPMVANAAWVMSGLVVLVLIGGVVFRKGLAGG